jgi:hypothetical protein
MSGNSLASLLQLMKVGSVTQGWGAVSVFSRSRLNRLLEQQYIERFNGLGFLPLFNGRLATSDNYDYIELTDISLGRPLLSFNNASLTNSTALLTMNIVAGRYTASHQPPGAEKRVMSTFNITEGHGFTLELDIDLSLIVGEVDRQGKVTLDLAEGANFRCNLANNDETAQKRLAEFFKQSFAALPPHRSVFQLGMLELNGYNRLNPKSFRILTQAAPGAKVRGALNYRDGAVVIAIQLQGNTGPGRFPLDSNFPYLIPDDQASDGSDQYSATLVLSEAMIPYVEGNRLDVLNNLLFPGENVFEESERHVPRDLAVFGNINPKQTKISLEPAFKTIKAGDTQRFTLHNWKGEVIQASNWRAVSLGSHTTEGHGTIAGGLYTAASPAHIGHDTLHVVVTADYVNAGVTYSASALLRVAYDSVTIAPRVDVVSATALSQPVVLRASTLGTAPMNWKLLAPEYGTLTQSANQGLFTADARSRAKGLAVQQIEATGAETNRASLLLLNAQQLLRVDPAHVPAVRKSVVVPLKDDATLLPDVPRRWKVVGGGGTVDASGRFTAPAQGITASSVVQCEIVRNGVVFSSGYSVIELSEMESEPSWKELSQFTIKVPGGLEGGRLGSLYANGYQQVRAQIVVETLPVDGKEYPLSVYEKASMRLVDNTSKAEIDFVDDALDGIPEGDSQVWRTRLIANRFELAIPRSAAQDDSPGTDLAPISVRDIYLHTRERPGAAATFYVTFQADSDNRWWKSTDLNDINNMIDIRPLPRPAFDALDYTFTRVRVDGGSAAPGAPEEDDFDFHLRTVDYWKLSYSGRAGIEGAAFETLEFLPVDGKDINTTTIRWESEQVAETMFSWTGYIFQDPQKSDETRKVKFDEATSKVVKNEGLDIDVNQSVFEKGLLVISLHRSDRVNYIGTTDPARVKLSRNLAVRLIDKNGNVHLRRIAYLPSSVVGDRNKLEHTLFSPSSN